MKFILPVPRIFGHYIFQNFNNCGKNEVPVPATVRAPYMQLTENPFRNLEIPHLQNLAGTIDPDIGNSIMGVPQPPYTRTSVMQPPSYIIKSNGRRRSAWTSRIGLPPRAAFRFASSIATSGGCPRVMLHHPVRYAEISAGSVGNDGPGYNHPRTSSLSR